MMWGLEHTTFTFVFLSISIEVARRQFPLSVVRLVFGIQPTTSPLICTEDQRVRRWLNAFNSIFANINVHSEDQLKRSTKRSLQLERQFWLAT